MLSNGPGQSCPDLWQLLLQVNVWWRAWQLNGQFGIQSNWYSYEGRLRASCGTGTTQRILNSWTADVAMDCRWRFFQRFILRHRRIQSLLHRRNQFFGMPQVHERWSKGQATLEGKSWSACHTYIIGAFLSALLCRQSCSAPVKPPKDNECYEKEWNSKSARRPLVLTWSFWSQHIQQDS